jgi:tripartite-type tricarboxylate transporter receptor subunit TctC
MLRGAAGIDFIGVPHKGGAESVTAVLGQQVDFALESPVILLPLIREGKLRALAVTSSKRKAEIAEIPTMREGGADFVATLLTGVGRTRRHAGAIVERLNAVINDSLKTPEMQATLRKFGSEANISTPQEFAAYPGGRDREVGRGEGRRGCKLD